MSKNIINPRPINEIQKPIAVLTDDLMRAFRAIMLQEGDNIIEFSFHHQDIFTKTKWYKFFTDKEKLLAFEIKEYIILQFHHSHGTVLFDMVEIARTRIR